MVDDLHAMVRGWLIKAKHDLESAHRLAVGDDPLLDTAIYHCQQAAEKAVKGFLVLHGQPFGKTHDIRILIEQAEKDESGFALWQGGGRSADALCRRISVSRRLHSPR